MKINTTLMKLKNRRVRVGRLGDAVYLHFVKLKDSDTPCVISTVTKKTVTTELVMSKAAAVSLYYLLQKELTLSDLVEFEKESGQEILNK